MKPLKKIIEHLKIEHLMGLFFAALLILPPALATAAPEKPQYGGVLKIVDLAEGAQPIGAPWAVRGIDSKLQKPCLESLVREDVNGNYHPWLAKSWKIDKAKHTLTLFLRKGVKFQDGTDFNAEAAAWVMNRSIKDKLMKGFLSADVIDNYTLRINTEKYENVYLHYLSESFCNPVSPTAYKKKGEQWAKWHPVGTGPFKFVSYARGDRLIYKKWDGYWRKGLPYLDGIEYLFIRDPMTQQAAMRAKGAEQVSVLCTTSGQQAAMLKAQGFKAISMPVGPVSLIPDSKDSDSPLSKRKVRQAISYAINREAIAKARGFGFWTAANQIPSPGEKGYVKNLDFGQYNPRKAKALLAEAGYPHGFKIKIYVMPALVDRDAMVAVQHDLGKVGVQVDLEFPDNGGYNALRWHNGWHDAFLAQHTRMLATFNITYNFYWQTMTGQFPSLARTPDLVNKIDASLATLEPEDAKGQELTRMMADDAMFIPIYYVHEIYVLQRKVHDTGYTAWSASTVNTPEVTWMSK